MNEVLFMFYIAVGLIVVIGLLLVLLAKKK